MIGSRLTLKLVDSARHGPGSDAELFIVEGDSAAAAVAAVRNSNTQAVLPMMGKPLNAVKAPLARVESSPLFAALVEALGAGQGVDFALANARFERVILLMDADADGIHCGALMCLYFHRMMRPLLQHGRVAMAHAPMATFYAEGRARHVFTDEEYREVSSDLRERGVERRVARYRGLAGLDRQVLAASCVDPATRTLRPLGPEDALVALDVFGGDDPETHVSQQRRLDLG